MTILVNDLETNTLTKENLGSLYPQGENDDSNYIDNNGNNNNDNYKINYNEENPKIYNSEEDKTKKYSEQDNENKKIENTNNFESSTETEKERNYYDKDDDDNNHELKNSFLEGLLKRREEIPHSTSKKCCKKCIKINCFECSNCKKMRPINIILIQFGIIFVLFILGFASGLTKFFRKMNGSAFYVSIGAQVTHILMSLFRIIYILHCEIDMKNKCWYIYLIPFIPIMVIYSFILFGLFDSSWQIIITTFIVIIFALLVALMLKGKRPRLLIVLLLLSSAIVLVPSLLIFGSNTDKLGFLIGFSAGFDFYLWIIYCCENGLYNTTDIIHEVAAFDYGFYMIPGYMIYGLFIYPFIWISKKCYQFFANDEY